MTCESNSDPARWTPAEDRWLRANYRALRLRELAERLARTVNQVYARARRLTLGLKLDHDGAHWTEAEERWLSRHYPKRSISELAWELARTATQVYARARDLGLGPKKPLYERTAWKKAQDVWLVENYPAMTLPKLAEHLHRTVSQVYCRARKLGLGPKRCYDSARRRAQADDLWLMARRLGRPGSRVRRRLDRLGLASKRRRTARRKGK